MRCIPSYCLMLSAAVILAATGGCGDTAKTGKTGETHEHVHGPHDGHLIELGNEEYHGEIVHDEKAGTVTIYILDGTAKKAEPIDAKEVSINVRHGKSAEQFKLAASPDKRDPEGQSSRFVSDEKHLSDDLDAKDAQAELVVEIKKKQYRGKIPQGH